MSRAQSLEVFLGRAKEKEKTYDWLEAAGLYEEALRKVGERDFLKRGRFRRRLVTVLGGPHFKLKPTRSFSYVSKRPVKHSLRQQSTV